MGTWVKGTSGHWTMFGTGRTALIAERDFPADSAFKLQLARPNANHLVFAMVLASRDGRTGYEIGVIGANIVIRSVWFGDLGSVTQHASAAHGLDVTQPFTMEIRFENGEIQVRLNGSSSAVVSHTPGDGGSPTFAGYKHFGFVSNVNNAVVGNPQLCDLIPQTVERADLLIAACGSDGFVVEGTRKRLLRAGMFNASGDVSMVEFNQKVYAVDGAHAWIIDPVNLTVEKWIPTAGSLPGQTEDGTTTARFIALYRGRIWLAGMPGDPQNILASAVNDPLDWDTGVSGFAGGFGGAFGLTAAQIGRIGQPVTCLIRSTRNSLIIGCNSSIWELIGDPTTGLPELREVLNKAGITGKDAATSVAEGRLVVHTTAGAYLIPALGEPIPFSSPVLTEGMQIPRDDIEQYIVQVRRDPTRDQVYFFFTRRVADGASTHVAYDEKVGGYSPPRGGWEPDDFAERFGPTASTPEPYQDHIVWGTRDGHLMVLDDSLHQDDGETVTTRVPLALLDEFKLARETILNKFLVLPSEGATVKYRVYGALTPEKVYGYADGRYLMLSGAVNARRQWIDRKVRAPAIVVELYSDANAPFGIEDVDAVTTAGRLVTQRDLAAAAAPAAPCTPPVYPIQSSSSSETSFGSGPGWETQFSTDEGTLNTGRSQTEVSESEPSSGSSSSGSSDASSSDELTSYPIGHTLPDETLPGSISSASVSSTSGLTSDIEGANCTQITDVFGDVLTICQTDNPKDAPEQ